VIEPNHPGLVLDPEPESCVAKAGRLTASAKQVRWSALRHGDTIRLGSLRAELSAGNGPARARFHDAIHRPFRRRSRVFLSACIILWVQLLESARSQIGSPSDPICRLRPGFAEGAAAGRLEYDVKAALLYRCLEMVQWPSNATSAAPSTLTVGILGKNQFGESLTFLAGKTVSGRKLVVTKLSRTVRASHCDVVFVSTSETGRTAKILDGLDGFPVLTVGEVPGFTEQGGVLNLLLVGKKIRLEINQAAAEKAGIRFDPKLIELVALQAEPALTGNDPSSP
jgi:hypothetical protein